MENTGYPDPDMMHALVVESVLVDNGIMAAADVNYEFNQPATGLCWLKTFSKNLHSGIYVKFDPSKVTIDFSKII